MLLRLVRLGSPLGWLSVPITAGPARRSAAAGAHLLAALWAVRPVAFRGAARIRPHIPGFLPGPSPSAGLCPSLVQDAAGLVTPGDRVSSVAATDTAAANPAARAQALDIAAGWLTFSGTQRIFMPGDRLVNDVDQPGANAIRRSSPLGLPMANSV